ncbi:MAG: hypothetical protein IRZ16_17105 [Myxococcaceae bacterium]|nr:hypothetical protein [Myxococcaceae bacterium]
MRPLLFTLLAVAAVTASACSAPPEVCVEGSSRTPTPLAPDPKAGLFAFTHAHNDYEHERPLEDALAQKFHSVEADVYYAGGLFEVSHLGFGARGTLKSLYLDPLQAKVDERGSVLGDGAPFTLWVDLKDAHDDLGDALAHLLDQYPMLTVFDADGTVTPGPVTVVLTGDRKMKEAFVREHTPRRAIRDSNDFSPDDPPATSAWGFYALDWGRYLSWGGSGSVPAETSERLACIANKAHQSGYRVRLYNTPDTEAVWQASLDHGIDFLNSDRLAELKAFLESR